MAKYQIDKTSSRFTVRAFARGTLSALGHSPTFAIRDFRGEADFDAAAPGQASLRIEIRAESLEVTDEIKSKDRREIEGMLNEKVLESSKYPAIVFASAEVKAEPLGEGRFKAEMQGDLALRGLTRRIPVAAPVTLSGDMMRAYGEFSLFQSDYGIPLVSVAGGALKLKDELKFAFDIVVRKQD